MHFKTLTRVLGKCFLSAFFLGQAPSVQAANGVISQTNWSLKFADSQELVAEGLNNGRGIHAFDGNPNTYWHTRWTGLSVPAHPHEIQINLGGVYSITGFRYLPMQFPAGTPGGQNGQIKQYEFYVSTDGTTWGTAAATGMFDNSNTQKEVTFASKTGQYIRLRALSEIAGNVWTSAAEINVLGTVQSGGSVISQANWTLRFVDSEELVGDGANNGRGIHAFDGNSNTYWHTRWTGSSVPAHPHEIQINLGAVYSITGFRYLPMQFPAGTPGGQNGQIKQYEFYVSTDGTTWGTAVATGMFGNSSAQKEVTFAAKTGQYIRLRAPSEINGNVWTSAAEINALGTLVVPGNQAPSVLVSWSPNTELDLAGYEVYYGTSSGNYGAPINVGNVTSYILTGLSSGMYFFAVKAYDTSGNESEFSNQVSLMLTETSALPVVVAPLAISGVVIVTFDNPAPAGSSQSHLDGSFQGIDFGHQEWRWEGAYLANNSNHIYFDSASGNYRSFSFSPAPKLFKSLRVSTRIAGTLTLSDNLGQTKSQFVSTGPMQVVTTNWTKASTTITIGFSEGWELAVDNIEYISP